MPCRVSVYPSSDARVFISRMNVCAVSKMMLARVAKVMPESDVEISETIVTRVPWAPGVFCPLVFLYGPASGHRPGMAGLSKSIDTPSSRAALATTCLKSFALKGFEMKSKAPFSMASLASSIMA